jgi:hypothetical protein
MPRVRRIDWIPLPAGWYEYAIADGVDVALPGIYQWDIHGIGVYVGKYTSIKRPTREYANNVLKLANASYYRKSKPDGYRRIHRLLEEAIQQGHKVTLTILENVDVGRLQTRETELIEQRGSLNDPPYNRRAPKR